MIIGYEKAIGRPYHVRRSKMKIKAKKTRHYKVAGRLERGQIIEVDPKLGMMLLTLHQDLEEVVPRKEKKDKEEEE